MDQNRFLKACKNGDITTLKSLDYSKIYIHANAELAFQLACWNGHLEVVKYLISLEPESGRINVHALNEEAFRNACENGHLDVVKYLISLEPSHNRINIHAMYEDAFRLACENGHLPIVKYLISLEPEYGLINIHARYEWAFRYGSFQIQHLLIRNYPNYNWKQVNGYYDYCTELNQIINNLSLLHQKMIQLRTDILELNVIGIVKGFLL
jgi:ankyrin repeat protein